MSFIEAFVKKARGAESNAKVVYVESSTSKATFTRNGYTIRFGKPKDKKTPFIENDYLKEKLKDNTLLSNYPLLLSAFSNTGSTEDDNPENLGNDLASVLSAADSNDRLMYRSGKLNNTSYKTQEDLNNALEEFESNARFSGRDNSEPDDIDIEENTEDVVSAATAKLRTIMDAISSINNFKDIC
jgi:hypothetical protein